ncbi:hypothetical protein ASPTUDRAFT_130632 [Aspergillus tubingensis CBS 134.48]|uniref:Uncharacterized protein n=1 Tax=Aspergillus tubingensis (strain CBS 134.48) TaxID=767770 RepID=A0A1L9MQR4_ASPTC|nr:hypothetical protein ASPTUDRAFT_130632 [Aspergillus tubingensis CBS 134.48]
MPDTLRGTSRSHHPGKTRQVKQSDFKQLIETPLVLEDRGPIDSTYLLRHLVQVVGEKFGDRLRSIGGMPENSDNPGVYLHILWSASNHQRMWLYVGQSSKLSERIANHNDPWYRRTHASLHYHVWDSVKDIESTFVTLVELKSSTTNADACLLNIQEMWMACIFQTLTAKHLDEYLPLGVCRMRSTRHLNVVPPIWQGFTGNDSAPAEACGGREAFQNLLLSPDPEIRRWAKAVRDSFNDLRNSPDPILRYYYSDIMARNRKLAEKAVEMRKMKELQNVLTNGSQKTVSGYDDDRSAQTLVCSDFCFIISRSLKLGLRVGDQVQLRFHLIEAPTQFAYANKALPTDPASRLVVSIEGIGKNGSFHVCLSSRGERIVRKMNSLVDALEGYTLEESKSFSRRWYVQRRTGTSVRDIFYT